MADLSIIVTAYNIEEYIEQCLKSVAAQTFNDIEVLVVDDGSSDSTPERITRFCAHDSRFIPVLLAENSPGGVATAANAGLDRARGQWVGFVDGDDYIEPTMFERLVRAARADSTDLAICQYLEVDSSGELRDPADAHRWAEFNALLYPLDIHTRQQFLRLISVPWRKLYRRDLLDDNAIRFPVTDALFEDNPFHWFTLIMARSIAVVPEVLCYHRVGRAGQTTASPHTRLLQIFSHHDTIHAWLVAKRLLDFYESTLLSWVISQMEWVSQRIPPELHRAMFDLLVPIFAGYSPETLATALREGNKGARARHLCTAVAKRDYGGFSRAMSARPGTKDPIAIATFHLRHSGLRYTATLTGRYIRNRIRGGRLARIVDRSKATRDEPWARDVMFGLMVIQERLRELDSQLSSINSRLAGIENHCSTVATQPSGQGAGDLEHEAPSG